jgi:hypothetical protein
MSVSPAISTELPSQKRSRWYILAAVTAAIHGSIYLAPIPVEVLRSSATGGEQYLILSIPAVWSVFIYLCFRQRSERVVTWISVVVTILWFTSVGSVRT